MRASPSNHFEFGPFRLDPSLPLLLRDGRPVPLPPKALETLVALVEHGGRVVSREELLEAVWPDAVVEENNLSVNVSLLRKALGEGEPGGYIETVPRRGYRFNAAVRELPAQSHELTYTRHTRSQTLIEESVETDEPTPAERATPRPAHAQPDIARRASTFLQLQSFKRAPIVLALVVVTVAALSLGAGLVRRGWQQSDTASKRGGAAAAGVAPVKALAVLPFKEPGPSGFGMFNGREHGELTDAVVARLGEMGNVSVVPQDALLAEKATPYNILLVGHALKVDAVLTGAVFRDDAGELKLRLHLVSTGGGEVLWADTLTSRRDELPELLGTVERSVLTGLRKLRSAEEYERRASHYTANREAYQHYLQGRFLWEHRQDVFAPSDFAMQEDAVASINQLERARALDPNFSLAYVGLADHYKTYDYKEGEWRLGEEHVQKALTLDPNLAEAHATLGFIRLFHYWDWTGAEAEFKRAIELDPDCVTAHQWYALFHALRGNHTESVKEITRARELAPYSISVALGAAEMQYYRAEHPRISFNLAVNSLLHIFYLYGGSAAAHNLLVKVYWMKGKPEKIATLASGEWLDDPQGEASLRAGPRKGSREFDAIEHPLTYDRALWNAALDRREEALDLLERAYQDHHFFIIYIKAEPFFKTLHDEPRYQDLLKKVGLAD